MPCEEKTALLLAYQKAAEAYTQAVEELGHAVGAVLHAEYAVIQRKVTRARELLQQAHNRLEDHERLHGCGYREA
jgi:hypothetical protein